MRKKKQKGRADENIPRRVWRTEADFRSEFPQIEKASIVYRQIGAGYKTDIADFGPEQRPTDLSTTGGVFECTNQMCQRGGFALSKEIREMAEEEQTERKSFKVCGGMPGGTGPSCMHKFQYQITVKYKPQ
jgi:hypothetical protein